MYTNSHDTALMRQGAKIGFATPGSAAEHKRTLARRLRTRLILCLIALAVAIPALILSASDNLLSAPDHPIIFTVSAAVTVLATFAAYSAISQYDGPPEQGNVPVSAQLAHDLTPQMRDKLFLARQNNDPRVLEEVIRHFEAELKKAVAGDVQKILKEG